MKENSLNRITKLRCRIREIGCHKHVEGISDKFDKENPQAIPVNAKKTKEVEKE